jgi:uncharacterized protein YndB with AHSA1/START domain
MKSQITMGDNRLQITRLFDAPRHLVFSFWTKVNRLEQWWGCKDTTRIECTMDFRVGGYFTCIMQIKGTGEFTYKGQYDEIVEPEKIAYHADFPGITTRVVVEFIELHQAQGEQTKMILTQVGFPGQNICELVTKGTSESFDKLDSLLAQQFVVNHV